MYGAGILLGKRQGTYHYYLLARTTHLATAYKVQHDAILTRTVSDCTEQLMRMCLIHCMDALTGNMIHYNHYIYCFKRLCMQPILEPRETSIL